MSGTRRPRRRSQHGHRVTEVGVDGVIGTGPFGTRPKRTAGRGSSPGAIHRRAEQRHSRRRRTGRSTGARGGKGPERRTPTAGTATRDEDTAPRRRLRRRNRDAGTKSAHVFEPYRARPAAISISPVSSMNFHTGLEKIHRQSTPVSASSTFNRRDHNSRMCSTSGIRPSGFACLLGGTAAASPDPGQRSGTVHGGLSGLLVALRLREGHAAHDRAIVEGHCDVLCRRLLPHWLRLNGLRLNGLRLHCL